MELRESAENYLENILMIGNQNGYVRSIDIATRLGFSKASVSIAMKKLRQDKLITMDENGLITMTKKGRSIAERIYERHNTLTSFFVNLGVDEETAANDACKIEHIISEDSYQKLKSFLKDEL